MVDTPSPRRAADVVVMGAGIAGLTAAIALTRQGMFVVCIEPVPLPRERVGESLDWAAPGLPNILDLSPSRLVEERTGTWKRPAVLGIASVYGAWFRGWLWVARVGSRIGSRPWNRPELNTFGVTGEGTI